MIMLEVTDSEKYRMMSNTDLLAIILGKEKKDVEKSADMLFEPTALYCSAEELSKKAELSQCNARKVLALSELMKRKKVSKKEPVLIGSAKDAYNYVAEDFKGLDHEELFVLFLNKANFVIKQVRFAVGAIDFVSFDVRRILAKALELKATGMIMQHNHPSGNTHPSGKDDDITKTLYVAGIAIGIPMIDHIIVTENAFYSYAEDKGFENLV